MTPVTTVEEARRVLTPAMRQAVAASAGEGADLRGLFHGATLHALIRHGLARSESGYGEDDHVVVLTGLGLLLRDDLRARVNEKLAERGYVAVEGSVRGVPLFRVPEGGGGLITRSAAMRRAGVKW